MYQERLCWANVVSEHPYYYVGQTSRKFLSYKQILKSGGPSEERFPLSECWCPLFFSLCILVFSHTFIPACLILHFLPSISTCSILGVGMLPRQEPMYHQPAVLLGSGSCRAAMRNHEIPKMVPISIYRKLGVATILHQMLVFEAPDVEIQTL